MADFYGAGFSAGLAGAERLNRIIADKMEQEVSETLHRQHIANGSTATEYTRVGFTSKSAAGDFVAQLNQHDIESAVIATKINGQYLVEIPKETAQQQIEEFNQSGHGYATDAINGYGTVSDNKLANDATGFESAYSNFILENIDTLGSAVLKVNNAIDTIDRQFNISSRLENMSDSQMSLHDQSQAIFAGIYEENERKIQELNAKRGVQEYVPEDFQNYVDQLKAERENVVNSFTAEEQQLLLTLSSGGVNEAILQKAIDDANANKQYAEASQLGQDLDKFLKEQSANELTSEQALAAFRETKDSLTGDKTLREAWKEQGIQSLHDGKFYLGDKESADKYIKARELADKIQKEGILNTTEAALERDLGISLTASLSYKDVLKANSAFLEEIKKRKIGMNVLDKKGNINVTAVALLKGSGQFDNKTLDFIIKTNQKQWTKMEKYGLGATLSTRLGSAYGKLAKALSKTGDAETNQMLRGISKTTSYTKKTVAAVKQYKNAMVNKRNLRKGLDTGKNDSVVKFKTQKEKTKKFNEEKFAKRAAKHEKAGQKAVARLNRRENSLRARAHRRFEEFKARMMNRLMQTKLGGLAFKLGAKASALKIKAKKFAMQLLIKISPVLGVILGFEAVLVIAICCIESIANFLTSLVGAVLGEMFSESAAVVLISNMQKAEDSWTNQIRDNSQGNFAYNNRDELKFGEREASFKTYIANTPISIDADNKVYINPFHKVDGLVVPDGNNNVALTALDGFDGRITASFAGNLSDTGRSGLGKYGETVGIESGHTSNIKDIAAMVEVMMDMDSANSTNDDIFGKTPAEHFFDTFFTNAEKIFKNIKTFFADLLNGNGVDGSYDWDFATNPWKRMNNYAAALFTMTHNTEINLSVDYYNLDSSLDTLQIPTVYEDGSEGNPTILGIDPVAIGVCPDPTYTPFKLFWDKSNNKPVPCLEKDGTIYRLDNGYFDVTLNMSNLASDDDCKNNKENQEQVCLWSGMANDNATLERIAGGAITFDTTTGEITRENDEGLSCWTLTEASNSDTNNVVTGSYTGHDCTSESSADQKAIDACNEKLTTARENAEKNFEENAEKYADNYYLDLTGGVDGDKFTVTLYRLATDSPKVTSRTNHDYEWTTTDEETGETTEHSETHYNATATATVYWKFKLTFTRHCKGDTEDNGHYFKYCGGHVSTHTTGMVLSITNEQLAWAGAYNSTDENPTVEDFEEYYSYLGEDLDFYSDMYGKYDATAMDYTTIYSLRTSCANGKTPPIHPQGSFAPWFVGGMNINVPFQPTSEEAGKDISAFDGMEVYGSKDSVPLSSRMLNDIFDADCLLMKGNNCLPTLTAKTWQQYEGWTADNMTIAGAKVTVDWLSAYGIDSPLELGGLPISTTTDTDAIIKALKETYGTNFTEERETAVKEALYWVGRAHYNNDEDHKAHAFLTEMHLNDTKYSTYQYEGSETFDIPSGYSFNKAASCTATDSEGLINYILYKSNASGVTGTANLNKRAGTISWSPYNGDTSNLLPADVLMHEKGDDESYLEPLNGYVMNGTQFEDRITSEAGFLDDQPPINQVRQSNQQGIYEVVPYKLGEDVLMAYNEERYVFYVGIINKDIVLTNGTIIRAGEPITIDIVPYFGMGTVRLHTRTPNDFLLDVGQTNFYDITTEGVDTPLDYNKEEYMEAHPDATEVTFDSDVIEVLAVDSMPRYSYYNQYWVCHPDSRTYVYHFKTAS